MPIISDMSSEFCSRPIDVKKYGVIYAGAQKNCGPAGNTIVIVRRDLIKKETVLPVAPAVINYFTVDAAPEQMYNTPTTWICYVGGLYLEYMNNLGIMHLEDMAIQKAKVSYDATDNSGGYYVNKF